MRSTLASNDFSRAQIVTRYWFVVKRNAAVVSVPGAVATGSSRKLRFDPVATAPGSDTKRNQTTSYAPVKTQTSRRQPPNFSLRLLYCLRGFARNRFYALVLTCKKENPN